MPFYLFPSTLTTNPESKDLLVVFWTYEFGNEIPDDILHDLRQKIDRYLSHEEPFDHILFMTHTINKAQLNGLEAFFENRDFQIAYSLTIKKQNIHKACFDENGFVAVENTKLDFRKHEHFIITSGLRKIFNRRGGMIGPSQHIHYVLPSKRHSNVFVRIGNILKKGVEINFVGFALLPYIREKTSNIYCDTSSIVLAAQAAVCLRKIINPQFKSPNIESFGSYEGVDNYQFQNSSSSLFLISVSTEQGLATRIFKRIEGQTWDKDIITMFRLPANNDDAPQHVHLLGKTVCNLENVIPKKVQALIYLNKEEGRKDCKLCDSNSTSVEIIGDEFLTEKQETIPVTLKEEYLPPWFTDVASKLIQQDFIRCHRTKKNSSTQVREIYIDIEKLQQERTHKSNRDYNARFEKYLHQKLPSALCMIIHLNDPASKTLAKQIKDSFNLSSEEFPPVIEYKDVPEFSKSITEKLPVKKGAILVVGSSLARVHSVKNISQDLRRFHEDGYQVCYLVALFRTESSKQFSHIRNTLTYGNQFKSETNTLDFLLNLYLPGERKNNITPWHDEIAGLQDFLDKHPISPALLKKDEKKELIKFKTRLKTLTDASTEGLLDDLFWPTPGNKPLKLTPGFIFFKFQHDVNDVTQADVYFTITSVLHYLRTEELRSHHYIVLQQSAHQRKVLDPENFNRFNDGIIQASLLRAAYEPELDYSHDPEISYKMKDFLSRSILKKEPEEASYEFLMALALSKIKLTEDDRKDLTDKLSKSTHPGVSMFARMILSKTPSPDNRVF